MKPMKVIAIKNLPQFTKGNEYEFNEYGIESDSGYVYAMFLNRKGDTYLEKWENYWNGDRKDLFVEVEGAMQLKDLKNGMVVETRDGRRFLVLGDTFVCEDGYLEKYDYGNGLKMVCRSDKFDVIKVYDVPKKLGTISILQTCKLELLWERNENQEKINELKKIFQDAKNLMQDTLDKIEELEG